MHDLAPLGINVLVALTTSSHGQSGIHVHVVAGEVETDEELEDHAPSWFGSRQENQQTGCCTSIRHHVQNSSELCGLVEAAGGGAIEGVKET